MIEAYVLGKIAPTKETRIKETLDAIPNVKEIELCFGKYDFIALCEAESIQALKSEVIEKIQEKEDIERTEILVIQELSALKNKV